MPFRHTDFDPELVKLLGAIWNHVCEEFSVTDEGQPQEVAWQMIYGDSTEISAMSLKVGKPPVRPE
jgi:hypothetical protein